MEFDITSPCYARHLGYWAIETRWFERAFDMVKSGTYRPPITRISSTSEHLSAEVPDSRDPKPRKPYAVDQGVAVIEINGPIMKGGGSFGEVDSVAVRRAVRAAARDEDIGSIMLLIDSPGGTVAGTETLASDVREAMAVKPVFAHIEDQGASAAYWIASQAKKITATTTSLIGSIGTLAVVEDTSGAAALEGVKVIVISTGAYKGAFTPGAPVLPEHIDYLHDHVRDLNSYFLEAVRKGRGITTKKVESWADGRMWIAEQAREMGLIDEVRNYDQAMDNARRAVPRKRATRAAIEIQKVSNALQR